MKTPDTDKIRSEEKLSLPAFLKSYNETLPPEFPRASPVFLKLFKKTYPALFKEDSWTLDQHRKKVMDWLPAHIKSLSQ